jgi:hypothetical protein
MKILLRLIMLVLVFFLISAKSALATPINYTTMLTGTAESPPNASPGTGSASVVIDIVANTLMVDISFSGLSGTTTASHIHGPTASAGTGTAGVATAIPTFPGFPLGVTSGSYSQTFDTTLASTYNPAFITSNGGTAAGAEAALAASLAAGTAYLNIHTTMYPGGEIRGFLQPVPEPATMLLLGAGLAGLGTFRIRKRKDQVGL